MPATLISASQLTDQAGPSTAFTSTTSFMVVCDAGCAGVQVQVGSNWYDYTEIDGTLADRVKVPAKNAMVVPVLFGGANYRLVSREGRATAAAYALT